MKAPVPALGPQGSSSSVSAGRDSACYSIVTFPHHNFVVISDGRALTGVYPVGHPGCPPLESLKRDDAQLCGVRDQLDAYFRGRLENFSIPLNPRGTEFQRTVWSEVQRIPWGVTASFQSIAETLGRRHAAGAVAMAIVKNPLSIIIPSHRVNGLTSVFPPFLGSEELTRWLINHEANIQPWRLISSRSSASIVTTPPPKDPPSSPPSR